jgi:hypothetical protein
MATEQPAKLAEQLKLQGMVLFESICFIMKLRANWTMSNIEHSWHICQCAIIESYLGNIGTQNPMNAGASETVKPADIRRCKQMLFLQLN